MAAYRHRYEELEADIAQARAKNDLGRLSRLQEERQMLGEEVARIALPNGDSKSSTNEREQLRRNVFMAIDRALKKIQQYLPELAEHLRPPTLIRGNSPSYRPHPPVEWEV
jgi:predicted HTH transcriptional regulator